MKQDWIAALLNALRNTISQVMAMSGGRKVPSSMLIRPRKDLDQIIARIDGIPTIQR